MKVSQMNLDLNGKMIPLVYRPNTTDLVIARLIFEFLCYSIDTKSVFPPAMKNFKPRFIIDGGANVGYASVFFANRYPECEKIVAIEPEIDNFEMLKYNTQYYPQVESIRAALWNQEIDLSVEMHPMFDSPTAYYTHEISENDQSQESIRGVTIGKIFRESGFKYIDILKLDVEGAEKEIFSDEGNYQEWLPFVKVLIIELHDRMKRGCSRNLFRAMGFYETFFTISQENLIFIREDLL
ncbi:MAG: FkbM family methyltransferase [Selenomonadaceae bacterium]|nr:FkbM family methyltransferase [Selenomonadaceae bacterium]